MKVFVKIEERQFEVKIEDIHARPIIAVIDGDTFEIWPEEVPKAPGIPDTAASGGLIKPNKDAHSPKLGSRKPAQIGTGSNGDGSDRIIRAPIPGIILSITTMPGSDVSTGQELLVLEAMKMKNSIRAPRAGRIKTIHVAPGSAVKHHDILVEFAE